MRNRIGIPDDEDAASAWWSMAETSRHFLPPESQIEFAAYLMTSVLTMAADGDALEDESAASVKAVEYALEVLNQAGW